MGHQTSALKQCGTPHPEGVAISVDTTTAPPSGTGSSSLGVGRKVSWVDRAPPLERQIMADAYHSDRHSRREIHQGSTDETQQKGSSELWRSRGGGPDVDMQTLFAEVPPDINLSAEVAKGCHILPVSGTYVGPPM
mmetsp:Transcript_31832/g.74380  ORF Transcript_31832/g.74380 Transcript_31832/m.74380 type:complete len:136 (+) Transcript_31832:131-538(+)